MENIMAMSPAPEMEPKAPAADPQRELQYNMRPAIGGPTTPGVGMSGGNTVPLQSVQFGSVGGPANSVSHDNPVSAATPNIGAAQGLTGSGIAR